MRQLLSDDRKLKEGASSLGRWPASTQLADIQRDVRQAVVAGEDSAIAPLLSGGTNPRKRLQIHRRHYETSLVTALLGKFPATVWLVGSQFVNEAAQHYIREHLPRKPCIAEYGEAFPQFLSACPAAERVPYLREFAELEWHLGHVATAIDHPALSGAALSTIPPEALPETVVTLQPGVRYLRASWPVDELMKLYLTDTAPESLEFVPEDVRIEVRGARSELRMNRLTRGDFTFRRSILEGWSIGDAADAGLDADASFDPGPALEALIAESLITAINHPRSAQ